MTLLFIMVISGVVEGVLTMAGQPSWVLLSKAGDSMVYVYGGYELLLGGVAPHGGRLPFEIKTPDIGLTALSMAVYLVVGLVLSIWISKRRQLA